MDFKKESERITEEIKKECVNAGYKALPAHHPKHDFLVKVESIIEKELRKAVDSVSKLTV